MHLKSKLDGLYFFAMSVGEYSDYRLGGFFVCDHPVSEEQWHEFCRQESALRQQKRSEIVTAQRPHFTMSEDDKRVFYKQYETYTKWVEDRGSYGMMFAAKHLMVEIDHQELHLDYD